MASESVLRCLLTINKNIFCTKFTKKKKNNKKIQINASTASQGLFGGLFGSAAPLPLLTKSSTASSSRSTSSNATEQQSFSELWIQFLLNEAKKQDQDSAAALPAPISPVQTPASSPQRKTPPSSSVADTTSTPTSPISSS